VPARYGVQREKTPALQLAIQAAAAAAAAAAF